MLDFVVIGYVLIDIFIFLDGRCVIMFGGVVVGVVILVVFVGVKVGLVMKIGIDFLKEWF